MSTIEELRREIAREKAYEESDIEMANLGKEKKYLEKELKARKFKRKYGKFVPSVDINKVKKFGSGIKSDVQKFGSGIKSGVQRLGSEVNKVRERQDAISMKRKTDLKPNKQQPIRKRVGLFG